MSPAQGARVSLGILATIAVLTVASAASGVFAPVVFALFIIAMVWPLQKWLQRSKIESGSAPGVTRTESAELREARKRIRLLEQENEVLRRAAAYLSQANLPGKGSTRS